MNELVHSDLTLCHSGRSESSAQRAIRGAEESQSPVRALWARAKRGRNLAFRVLREIFDESAYIRFLDRHKLEPSRGSYAAFRREHEHSKACRMRCC